MYVRGLIPSVLLQTLFGHWHLTKMQFVSFSTELVENSSLDKETVYFFILLTMPLGLHTENLGYSIKNIDTQTKKSNTWEKECGADTNVGDNILKMFWNFIYTIYSLELVDILSFFFWPLACIVWYSEV